MDNMNTMFVPDRRKPGRVRYYCTKGTGCLFLSNCGGIYFCPMCGGCKYLVGVAGDGRGKAVEEQETSKP